MMIQIQEIWHPFPNRTFALFLWRIRGPKQTRAALLVQSEQDRLRNKDLDGKAEIKLYTINIGY